MQRYPIIIIGAGPAGCAAAVQCQRLGITPLLLDRTGEVGGLVVNAWHIENYPGIGPTNGAGFVQHLRSFLTRFGIVVYRGDVASIERTPASLILRGSFSLPGQERERPILAESAGADCVILAPGTRPKKPQIGGLDALIGASVFFEVGELLRFAPGGREVAILGGGEAACDYALRLAQRNIAVTLLLRDHRLRAHGRLARLVSESKHITLRVGVELTHIGDKGSRMTGRETSNRLRLDLANRTQEADNTCSLDVDTLLIAVGRTSAATPLIEGSGLTPTGDIRSDDPRVFVAGDARTGTLGQIGMAVGDGLAAAMAAVSHRESAMELESE